MAITQNTYTGNGSTVLFSFTFPYLETTDIKVSLNGVNTTAYTLANATTIQFNSAPADGTAIRIYRQTDDNALTATFSPGSAIRSQDLNDNFTQNLYVTQESIRESSQAVSTVTTALATANTASTNASNAVSTANTASTNASNAVSTANTANTNASSAVTTANAASITANAADAKADAAIATVASSVNYTPVANVAGIPASPSNNTYIEINNSTGIQSFTPLLGIPSGFVGDAGLAVRLYYTTTGATWNWLNYYANDSDARFLKKTGGTMTGKITLDGNPSSNLHAATKQYVDNADSTLTTATATAQATADAALPRAGGTMTGAITFAAGQNFPGAVTNVSGTAPISVTGTTTPTVSVNAASTSASGVVQLSDSTSSTSSSTAATSAAVKSVQDFAQVCSSTANAAMPRSGGTFTGDVTFNTTTATVLPVGSTAQRPTGASGMIRFNTTVSQFEGFNGTVWSSVGGGATGGGADRVFQENDNTVTTNYTLSTNRNAVSAGPVTVNNGVTVTIPSGSAWVIV